MAQHPLEDSHLSTREHDNPKSHITEVGLRMYFSDITLRQVKIKICMCTKLGIALRIVIFCYMSYVFECLGLSQLYTRPRLISRKRKISASDLRPRYR
jgi:hypothetical protein